MTLLGPRAREFHWNSAALVQFHTRGCIVLTVRESGEEDLGARDYSAAATQLVLCLRIALLKGESWLRAEPLMT